MGFGCGIVGLPNVGKSSLFNALTRTAAAQAENYPFCTIEPNIGDVAVPDVRLEHLARCAGSQRHIPARTRFVDIAGLVRGASAGEGLGNTFLAAIRETDAIVHVVRCFENDSITHVDGRVDPVADVETISTELMLADLDSLQRRRAKLEPRARSGQERDSLALVDEAIAALDRAGAGRPVHADQERWKSLELLSCIPVLYVANVDEATAGGAGNEHVSRLQDHVRSLGVDMIAISAAMEAEIAVLDEADQRAFLSDLGVEESGLARLVRSGYELLGLRTFFTAGPKEARAWTIRAGQSAQEAAGRIHSDFARGFICAEVVSFEDYLACGGETRARQAGKLRQEGREYVVADGDVIHFRSHV